MREPLDGQRFDVVVIGGGINGVAIARECARGGRRTLLVERRDFASGTTSRSTRIVHGGLRYLEQGELGLVRESLRERERLLRERPHLVRPLSFLLALRPGGRRSALAVRAGLWLYRGMSAMHGRSARDGSDDVARLERLLDGGAHLSVYHYEDAQCEFPERLVAEWLCEAIGAGAAARNYCDVVDIELREGRATGLRLRDGITGAESRVESRWIINATGPWADRLCAQAGVRAQRQMVGGVRGSHLVLPLFPCAPQSAVYAEAEDGRPVFMVPWNGQMLLGTTEIHDDGDPERSQPSSQEAAYLLAAAQRLFPAAGLRWSDVRCAFAGVRALPFQPGAAASGLTRRHFLYDHAADGAAGMISVVGGKLTTAACVARDCARHIGLRPREPKLHALAPVEEMETRLEEWARYVAAWAQIPESTARALAEWHGGRATAVARLATLDPCLRLSVCGHTDHLVAECVAAARWEQAQSLADLLLRRVPVALGACWSAECSRTAARRVGAALGWSERRVGQELEAFEAERLRFLQPPPQAERRSA